MKSQGWLWIACFGFTRVVVFIFYDCPLYGFTRSAVWKVSNVCRFIMEESLKHGNWNKKCTESERVKGMFSVSSR